MAEDNVDEILGITRCVQCGHRLEGEVECPFCSIVNKTKKKHTSYKWIYITAFFFTSPLSIYFIFKTDKLNIFEKILTSLGCIIWIFFYLAL